MEGGERTEERLVEDDAARLAHARHNHPEHHGEDGSGEGRHEVGGSQCGDTVVDCRPHVPPLGRVCLTGVGPHVAQRCSKHLRRSDIFVYLYMRCALGTVTQKRAAVCLGSSAKRLTRPLINARSSHEAKVRGDK